MARDWWVFCRAIQTNSQKSCHIPFARDCIATVPTEVTHASSPTEQSEFALAANPALTLATPLCASLFHKRLEPKTDINIRDSPYHFASRFVGAGITLYGLCGKVGCSSWRFALTVKGFVRSGLNVYTVILHCEYILWFVLTHLDERISKSHNRQCFVYSPCDHARQFTQGDITFLD